MVTKKSKKKKEEKKFDIFKSKLVPKCKIMSEEEIKELLEKYQITKQQLPKITTSDPVVKALEAKTGQIIEIIRTSKTAGLSKFYRLVVGKI